MPKYHYENILGFGWQCVDCGAFAEEQENVVHYKGCVPGSSEKWKEFYNQTPEQVEQERKDDEAYAKYTEARDADTEC